ncbi:MAG: efflux RND transporter periplasmic adaptor subunit, partial [Caulobacteraceae bacterium]
MRGIIRLNYMSSFRFGVTAASACVALAGCHKAVPAAKAAPRDPVTVTVATVRTEALAGGLTASGLLIPKLEAAVSTELNGYRVAQVFVDQDALVKTGQPLTRLDDTLLRAQIAQQKAMVDQQKVAAERQDAEAERVAGLDNQGVLSQEQIIERRLAARSGHAAVAAAQAQLNDLDTREGLMTVRAPVGGRVLERTVRPGDIAAPATAMFRIAADDVIELNAEVPESDLGGIRPGDEVQVELPSGAKVDGRVRLISPEVDQQTKLGHVRVTLPVRPDLRPGGYGRATFSQSRRPAPVVPDSAVRYDADGASV